MSITITQTCDGCKRERVLGGVVEQQNGGWRELKKGVHLCADCIAKAINEGAQQHG